MHRRAAATLLDWSEIPDGSGAKQRGRRQPLSASSSCECRQDVQARVCIRLAPQSSDTSLLDWSEIPDGSGAKQRGRRQPFLAATKLARLVADIRDGFCSHPLFCYLEVRARTNAKYSYIFKKYIENTLDLDLTFKRLQLWCFV